MTYVYVSFERRRSHEQEKRLGGQLQQADLKLWTEGLKL